MHRQQRPHSRTTTTTTTTTSPPSTKHRSFHRHTSSTSASSSSFSSSSSTTPTPTPTLPSKTTSSTTTSTKKVPSIIRPIYHRKSHSAHQLYHHHHHKSYQSLSKLLGAGSGPASLPVDKADDDMATSFLQYCAMCEKQIAVPSNSVLYCSESCRRKDSCKPLSASSYTYTMTLNTPSTSTSTEHHHHHHPPSPTMSPARIPSDLHDSSSDMDPTEWKPVIHGHGHGRGYGHRYTRTGSSASLATTSSDAWNYLSQFHSRDYPLSASSSSTSLPMLPAFRRPTAHSLGGHRNTSTTSLSAMSTSTSASTSMSMSMSMPGVPSLINTPSSAASSVTSSSPSPDYIGVYSSTVSTSTATTAAAAAIDRPLPPRHNPSFSPSGAGATKGVELVVPHIITPGDDVAAGHDDGCAESESAHAHAHAHVGGGLWLRA